MSEGTHIGVVIPDASPHFKGKPASLHVDGLALETAEDKSDFLLFSVTDFDEISCGPLSPSVSNPLAQPPPQKTKAPDFFSGAFVFGYLLGCGGLQR